MHRHINGKRFRVNLETRTVHDLHNEKQNCFLDDFIGSRFDLSVQSLEVAKLAGFSFCQYCLHDE